MPLSERQLTSETYTKEKNEVKFAEPSWRHRTYTIIPYLLGAAKVSQFHGAAVQQNVRAFNVAMNDFIAVQVIQALQNLLSVAANHGFTQHPEAETAWGGREKVTETLGHAREC